MAIDFLSEAHALQSQLIEWRRDFHTYPELGFQEYRSSGRIAECLQAWGYEVQTGIAQTGVVGLMRGGSPGPIVMLRFDMDALPIVEENAVPYRSQNAGVMHACGHDAHMAIGLGVAKLVAEWRANLNGAVKIVFQPGEEGLNGAEVMVNEGVLENPRPSIFLSVHVWSDLPTGRVAVSPGPVMAAAERWSCMVHGKGGHGALPNQTVDPVVAAAQIVTALQTIVSRNVSPLDTAVVTVGTLHGGDAFNIIPSRVEMSGTVRTFDPAVRVTVLERLRQIVEGVGEACGTHVDLEIVPLTPALSNDPGVTEVVRDVVETMLGSDCLSADVRTMGSEDAAFFTREIPGCYIFLGASDASRGLDRPHHNPSFDIDESALVLGVAILTNALGRYVFSDESDR
ncbi:MAG: amidohydrolase [Chloroflexi bacterium]|nr:amidohydrolase [Chloroflexota bacterium]